MNLFSDYQKKILNSLKILERKKIIQISSKSKSFTIELPPKNQKAHISCNAAMILAKANNISPDKLAEILKKHLLLNFKEFKNNEKERVIADFIAGMTDRYAINLYKKIK